MKRYHNSKALDIFNTEQIKKKLDQKLDIKEGEEEGAINILELFAMVKLSNFKIIKIYSEKALAIRLDRSYSNWCSFLPKT